MFSAIWHDEWLIWISKMNSKKNGAGWILKVSQQNRYNMASKNSDNFGYFFEEFSKYKLSKLVRIIIRPKKL